MATYKLGVLQSVAVGDGVAALDIQFDGRITAIDWSMDADIDAADETTNAEVSFLSVNTIGSNDARGSISACKAAISLITSESGLTSVNKTISGLSIPVAAGERIFLHTTGSIVGIEVYLYVEDDSDTRLRRRR